jgi:gliding motility-associated-like protein
MDSVNCSGTNSGALSVTASGGTGSLSYSWNTGILGQNLNNVGVGNYTIFVTDANNCQISQTLAVLEPLPLQLSPLVLSNACNNAATGSAQVSVVGGTAPYIFSWNNGQNTPIATNLAAGNYTVFVTDAKGCKKSASISIVPFVINLAVQNVSCFEANDGQITVNASGGVGNYHYSWDNGQTTSVISNLAIGTYKVWVNDTTTCILSSSATITQPQPLQSFADSLKMIDCFGTNTGTANIILSGGTKPYAYSWSPANVQISQNATGILAHHLKANTYTLWITDAHQCVDSLQFTLTESPAIKISIAEIEKAYCNFANGNALVNVSGGNGNYTYSWNTIPSQDSNYLQKVIGGIYKVYVTDAKGCKSSLSVPIPNTPPPTTFFTSLPSNNVPIFEYNPINFLNQSQNAVSYSWNFGDNTFSNLTNPTHIYEYANSYTVTLIGYDTHKECPTSFSMTYFILPDGRIFIPSAFSPNGDNTNDEFFVSGTGIIEMELTIFDRWGKVITVLDSPDKTWNGLDANGKPCPEGAYTFKATVSLNNGYQLNRGGTITLFR